VPIVFGFQFLFEYIEFRCKWKYVVLLVVAAAFVVVSYYIFQWEFT